MAVPLLPADDVRSPVKLVCTPNVPAVTSTMTVQVSPAPRRPSEKVMVPPPPEALSVASSQSVEALAGSAMSTSPGTVGRTSVNARLVTGPPRVLSMVKISVLTLPGPMVSGLKNLEEGRLGIGRRGGGQSHGQST